jgi:hypothetical protein
MKIVHLWDIDKKDILHQSFFTNKCLTPLFKNVWLFPTIVYYKYKRGTKPTEI